MSALLALIPAVSAMLDKVLPDADAKAQAQLELVRLQQEGALKELDASVQLALAQAKINEIEAAQSGLFQSGWRPAAGWICVAGLGYEFLLRPILPWALAVYGADAPPLPSLDDVLFELVFSLLGLGAMREYGRKNRVDALAK